MTSRVCIQLPGSRVFRVDDKLIENAFFGSRKWIGLIGHPIMQQMKACCQGSSEAEKILKINIDTIRNKLIRRDHGRTVPFFCDHTAFNEIHNIRINNPEHLISPLGAPAQA